MKSIACFAMTNMHGYQIMIDLSLMIKMLQDRSSSSKRTYSTRLYDRAADEILGIQEFHFIFELSYWTYFVLNKGSLSCDNVLYHTTFCKPMSNGLRRDVRGLQSDDSIANRIRNKKVREVRMESRETKCNNLLFFDSCQCLRYSS